MVNVNVSISHVMKCEVLSDKNFEINEIKGF